MKLRCIAIDDEPLALKQISAYIEKTPFLELVCSCKNALEALDFLHSEKADLIFVDINMPDLNGMDFVKSLEIKPLIIFTTAYSQYAIEGFKVDATDYLLKPISYENFLKSANKAKNRFQLTQKIEENNDSAKDYLFVKADYKLKKIEFSDVKFIESQHEYIKFYLKSSKPVMTLMSMKSIETQLPKNFLRVHRSYIVNLDNFSEVERSRILFDDNLFVPVGEQYKEKFNEFLDGKK